MSPAQAKRDRAALMRSIEREIRAKNRARLVTLRGELRALKGARRRAIHEAIARCRERKPPTLAAVRAELAQARARAREACDVDVKRARALKDDEQRKREELKAERAYQREIRRIERDNRLRSVAKARRRSTPGERRSESDDEVRGNIPPELVELFERVKRQIKGSDRMSRTEAFLHYAEEHPDEQWAALEDRTDEVIRELERRQAMANPRKKKKKARRAAPKRPAKRAAPRKSKLEKSLDRARAEGRRLREKIADMKHRRRNPKRPPGRWFDRCLASVEARGYASDPAAVCGAAWWRMPEHRRAAIVRRLERKGGRHRRAAYAIARAEQRRADRHRRGKKKTLR